MDSQQKCKRRREFETSDHWIVAFDLKLMDSTDNTQNQNKENYFSGNYEPARKMIEEMNIVSKVSGRNSEENWRIFSA